MLRIQNIIRKSGLSAGCCALLLIALSIAPATAAIEVRLNVLYAQPNNPLQGGVWELVAKSTENGPGLSFLKVLVANISTSTNNAPRGLVNGGMDGAGFSVFEDADNGGGRHTLTFGQLPILPSELGPGEEQPVFYGVGAIANGTPNYLGKPPTATPVGPLMNTLTAVNGVPFANPTQNTFNEPAWARTTKMAVGTFAAGLIPGIWQIGTTTESKGSEFLNVGNSMTYGAIGPSVSFMPFVKTNLTQTADYNHNGVVDTADYVVWRNTLGLSSPLDADGNSNGMIDDDDYNVWRRNYGLVLNPGSGSGAGLGSGVVPEPTSAILLVTGMLAILGRGFRRRTDAPDSSGVNCRLSVPRS